LTGYTEVGGSSSDILQKVQLDIISNQQCREVYDDEDNYSVYGSQMCAGESQSLLAASSGDFTVIFVYFRHFEGRKRHMRGR
jgi:Trypsin